MNEFTPDLLAPIAAVPRRRHSIHGNQDAMDGFAQVNAATIPPQFFAAKNIEALNASHH